MIIVVEDAARPRQRTADYHPLITRRYRASQQADEVDALFGASKARLRSHDLSAARYPRHPHGSERIKDGSTRLSRRS